MAKKRLSRSPPTEHENFEDDDDFLFDDTASGRGGQEPQHRNAANARERARMRVLSKAFCRLKTTLPWVPADTKLSKLDTLRLAASYIAHLRAVLKDERTPRHAHPLAMAWPFAFQHGTVTSTTSKGWSSPQPESPSPARSSPQCDSGGTFATDTSSYRNDHRTNQVYDTDSCQNEMPGNAAAPFYDDHHTYNSYRDNIGYCGARNGYSESLLNINN